MSDKSTKSMSAKNKIIVSAVAGLAVLSGTFAVVAGGSQVAQAATTATSSVTQSSSHPVRAWLKAHRKEIRAEGAKTVASTVGISTDELKQDLKNGQSISEIATAHSVDPQTVATALVNQIDARIDQAVTAGKLTQDKADALKGKVPTVVNKVINFHKGDAKAKATANAGN